jgi:hypothetical protein
VPGGVARADTAGEARPASAGTTCPRASPPSTARVAGSRGLLGPVVTRLDTVVPSVVGGGMLLTTSVVAARTVTLGAGNADDAGAFAFAEGGICHKGVWLSRSVARAGAQAGRSGIESGRCASPSAPVSAGGVGRESPKTELVAS